MALTKFTALLPAMRTPCVAALALLALPFAAPHAFADDLMVYAGAGLRPAVEEIAQTFEAEHGTKVVITYGGSGQILTSFKASQKGDVFLPGSEVYSKKLGDQIGPLQEVAIHIPVVGVAKDKVDEIKTFEDLAKPGIRVGLGDPKAMALGRTAENILKASPVGDKILANTVLRAATVKQLTLYLLQGDVDAAIISHSDAVLNKGKIASIDVPTALYTPEVVAVGVLKTSTQPELAQSFADLVASKDGIAAFTKAGFLPVSALKTN